jgi:predicted permease
LGDVRHALRLLARNPLFTITSVLSLAVGTTASSTLFGIADAMFFQAAPGIRQPDRVVDIERTTNGAGHGTLSYPQLIHLRDHSQTLEAITVTSSEPTPVSLSDGSGTERAYGALVSAAYFEVFRVRPAYGRFFSKEEDATGAGRPAIVLSHRFWEQRFGADPGVLNRPLRINGHDFAVIGIAERRFEGSTIVGTDLWVPVAMMAVIRGPAAAARLGDPAATWLRASGRLKPGISREAAAAELNTLLDGFKADHPAVASHGIRVASTGRLPITARVPFGTFVGLLFVLAAGLLAIACSNVAGMLLARAASRQREIATRLALGAGRGQLLLQMLLETLILFAIASLVALPLCAWVLSSVDQMLPTLPIPIRFETSLTARTLGFTFAACLVTALAFGLAPARHALRTDVAHLLHGRASTTSRERLWLRHALVVVQLALALAITLTGGLFVRTLRAASELDSGFRTAGVTVVSLDTTLAGATGSRAVPLMNRLVERVRSIGGVEAVGHSRMLPLQGGSYSIGRPRVPGLPDDVARRLAAADWDIVSPDYFRAVGLPLVQGRGITSADREGWPLVAVVNQTFARLAWPGGTAIGQSFWRGAEPADPGPPLEIVGVVKDARTRQVGEPPRPFVYVPFAQHPEPRVELFVKHAGTHDIASEVRRVVASVEPALPVVEIQSFDEATGLGLFPQRVAAWTAGMVGGIGVFLAALGLYGITAFVVAQRTREIAIRMALGASAGDVRAMVLRQAARLCVFGTALGLLIAWGIGTVADSLSLLIGVRPADPLTFAGLSALLCAVLLGASYAPARRAAATDPAAALRAQ